MGARVYNVLFLCTHNSSRSLIAETLLNHLGHGRFRAYSAGSHPSGKPNPYVVEFLNSNGLPTGDLRSKSWDEFAAPGAPPLDFVITVCDQAAGEACPVWRGRPMIAHWGVKDPSRYANDPTASRKVIHEVAHILQRRIELLTSLPLESLDRLTATNRLKQIGEA